MRPKNRINLRAYRTPEMLRWTIWSFDLRSATGTTLTKRGPCPLCSPSSLTSRSLAVDIPKGVWYCHSCRKSGDAITLYALLAKVSCWEAAVALSDLSKSPVPWLDSASLAVMQRGALPKHKAPNQTNRKNQYDDDPPASQPQISQYEAFLPFPDASGN